MIATDNAAVSVERLDDVELKANGQTLLYQLKHSLSAKPPRVTLKSRAIWKTIKVWIDALPSLTLSETKLHLVAVGSIPANSPLKVLTENDADRADLVAAMVEEAERVIAARDAAAKAGQKLPFGDRVVAVQGLRRIGDRAPHLRRPSRERAPAALRQVAEQSEVVHLDVDPWRLALEQILLVH